MREIFIVKNKLNSNNSVDTARILNFAKESLDSGEEREYYTTGPKDGSILCDKVEQEGIIMLVSYVGTGKITSKKIEETEIKSIYIGEMIVTKDATYPNKGNIKYQMKKCISSKKVIINLLDGLELDLAMDFDSASYVLTSKSKELEKTLTDLMKKEMQPQTKDNYMVKSNTYELDEKAQHNHQCKRMYGCLPEDVNRNEFQRDRERIVNSKAFRRLVDKAQIFSAEKGDHYRTRMTHTLEVNQISKAIACALNLNLDLTEAIALAHDLGHTPFGHQGERTLYDILTGEKQKGIFNIADNVWQQNPNLFGGFKHNYQSVRVLTTLEEKYIGYSGLDVSLQVLEGVLKHTKLVNASIEEFIDSKYIQDLHLELEEDGEPFASTLEGQVVAIADEIAQRGHDIDDAISSGLITAEELLEALSVKKFEPLYILLTKEKEKLDNSERVIVDEKELLIGRIISVIVGFLINDVVECSSNLMKEYSSELGYFDKCLIQFSAEKGKTICEFLKKVVNKRVISNTEVTCFDNNGSIVVEKLFYSYYTNPKLLHKGKLRKIYIDQLHSKCVDVAENAIDWANGNIDVTRMEINRVVYDELDDLSQPQQREIFEKRKILVRNIVDYIAGMTDSYAVREYEKIK